ncbi:MAG TPA: TonB family protein [Pyrinomonadaceae bacterium]|nr:TonB family protein [Pyrinomonadaceae bacterium]
MNPGNLSLMGAVTDGDTEAVRALLAAGSDVNRTSSGGRTPLILATLFGRTQIMSLLLEAGADPQQRDSLGLNAVDWAERKGFAEAVKLLTQWQASKQETPPGTPSSEPITPGGSAPSQFEKPTTRASTQSAGADDKSRRWLAGLKRRIDEEASHKVKEAEPAPPPTTEIEATPQNEPPAVVVNDRPVEASAHVPEPTVNSSAIERLPNVPTEAFLRDQTSPAEAIELLVPPDDLLTSEPPPLTIWTPPPASNTRKRCPKCNAVYGSELLAYCAIDATPLVDANQPVFTPPPESARMPLIWLLVVLSFIVAAGGTYFMIPDLRSEPSAPPGPLPTQVLSPRDAPLVAGELSGKQLEVPVAEYPASARSEHVSGMVTVRVTVNKKGKVIAVKVLEGDWRLRKPAIAAALKATFSAEKLVERRTVGTIAYTFKE